MKTIQFIRYTLLFIISFSFFSCDDSLPDTYLEKEYPLADFKQIKLGEAFQIEIGKAEDFSVIAKGEQKDLDDLILVVEGDQLSGHYREGSRNHKRTLLQIFLPELTGVDLHAASSTRISGFDASDNSISIKVSGASEAKFIGKSKNLAVEVDGASLLTLTGEADNITAEVRGASELRAKSFKVKIAQMQVHSHSHANIDVANSLSGGVHGGSSLLYYGNPSLLEVSVETGSSLVHGN